MLGLTFPMTISLKVNVMTQLEYKQYLYYLTFS